MPQETIWLDQATTLERLGQRPDINGDTNRRRIDQQVLLKLLIACAQCGFVEASELVEACVAPYAVKVLDVERVEIQYHIPLEDNPDLTIRQNVPWFDMVSGKLTHGPPMRERFVLWCREDIKGHNYFWCCLEHRHDWLAKRMGALQLAEKERKTRSVTLDNGDSYYWHSENGIFKDLVRKT